MTEKLQLLSTQAATPNQSLPPLNSPSAPISPVAITSSAPVLPPPSSAAASTAHPVVATVASALPVQNATAPKMEPAVEEEPYTIKCICGYQVDDGSTIYCEICDSWQHIECFYPNNSEEATREEFSHACHECKPRPLDVAHAIEYQKQRINAATLPVVPSQKPKRPPSKSHQSHKKKTKSTTDLTINGLSVLSLDHAADGHHPAHSPSKRSKNGHRASHSVSGVRSKRSPSYSVSRTPFQNGHPLSPATTPPDITDGAEIHNYSSDFLSLCNDQDAVQNVQTNSFASLAVSNTTSIWLREHERMLRETGHTFNDVFQPLPSNIESLKRPPRVDVTKRVLGADTVVRWRFLTTSAAVDKDVPMMELNGQVGFQKDYCAVPANRYEELSCPLPFVFFHPMLPLYIDTRREGSLARYVRRSCRPNAVLDTYLSSGSEYQFWLVSDRRIAANEQITIPWDFRLPHDAKARMLRLLGLGDDDTVAHDDIDIEEDEFTSIARWVYLILSEYGGCACQLGSDCAFARFHRNYSSRAHARNGVNGGAANKKKASRKAKASHALSPTSTSHAVNSRAASEGHFDDFPENDKVSTSSRSKPPSRDMTPVPRQGSFDTLGILTEPTDRDKRKVAMVEDSFRRLEQQPPRKKKRTSDGTGISERSSVSSKSKPKGSPNVDLPTNGVAASRHYVDASTSRSKSGSPATSMSPQTPFTVGGYGFSAPLSVLSRRTSAGPPPTYTDACVQTEPVEGEWYATPVAPNPRRRVVSLSRRLLNRYHSRRVKIEEDLTAMQADTPAIDKQQTSLPSTATADVPMADAPPASGPLGNNAVKPLPSAVEPSTERTPGSVTKEATPEATEVCSKTVVSDKSTPATKRSPDLHVQLPKIPSFGDVIGQSASTATPISAASSIVQSPFAMAHGGPFSPAAGINGATVATPSPIKKKMSLSDYTKSRKAAAGRPTLKASTTSSDDAKTPTSPDGTCDDSHSPTTAGKGTDGPSTAPVGVSS